MNKRKKVLFINLAAFSLTGGIEKFNKCFLKALIDISKEDELDVASFSLYDQGTDEDYFPGNLYKGFNQKKILFVKYCVSKAGKYDTVILGHINLAIIGYLVKFFFPNLKIVLIAHGIEVWQPLRGIQKAFLKKADKILAVSNYTRNKLCEIQKISADKISIFPNTIDPFFMVPQNFDQPAYLNDRYGILNGDYVLYTLTRLSSAEKYKGYDMVIKTLPKLKKKIPNIKYIIGGKYDNDEKNRVEKLIGDMGLTNEVRLTGFIKNEEICDHYQLGNIFIMPSYGEGFGIVFIEAAVCGSKLIAGNKDGSVDALKNGELGILVDPNDTGEISAAVMKLYNDKLSWNNDNKKELQELTLSYYGFNIFKNKLRKELMVI